MNKAQIAFEAYMFTKGITANWNGKSYQTANLQTKWRYFLIGWKMKETNV